MEKLYYFTYHHLHIIKSTHFYQFISILTFQTTFYHITSNSNHFYFLNPNPQTNFDPSTYLLIPTNMSLL